MNAVAALLSALINWGTSFLEHRQKIGEAKTAAKIELQKTGASGWTGRLLVIFWFYPAVACFVPYLSERAGDGFKLMMAMPEWYIGLLVTITVTLLGIEKIQRVKGGRITQDS
ncbi:hypothetical protein [Streptomyces sp. B29(2018)]|uniref:hypothetical protein n=1 Tax=Streptomyces sp. B29(2018) TaxID=2485016 RepID=UPI000FD63CA0|nr:hypothetical protein [Streptomyces sp. B29(2018)]